MSLATTEVMVDTLSPIRGLHAYGYPDNNTSPSPVSLPDQMLLGFSEGRRSTALHGPNLEPRAEGRQGSDH
jgi:hypothetical protein